MHERRPQQEDGIALLLVIIALLLVTAVAAGMVILSNTETNVDANYRDEQMALFAAKAGLEEARDRLLSSNANPITPPTVLPGATGGAYASYITASAVSPWSSSGPYEDKEYLAEMGLSSPPSGSTWYASTASNSNYSGPSANPLPYQWVRINLKIDQSAYTAGTPYYVDGNASNASKQVCYDPVKMREAVITAATCSAANSTYQPVYEVTSFAVTPSGTHRMLQQEVVSLPIVNLYGLSGALTLCGNGSSTWSPPSSNNWEFVGTDASNPVDAIATCNSNDTATIQANLPKPSNYIGKGGTAGSAINNDSGTMSSCFQSVTCLNNMVTTFTAHANQVFTAPAAPTSLGTAANPLITVINGNYSGCQGAGILVVTGTLSCSGSSSFDGVIFVIGQGNFQINGAGSGSFYGAFFVAKTEDSSGNPLASVGAASFTESGGGANSLNYSSSWVSQMASLISTYTPLSARELSF